MHVRELANLIQYASPRRFEQFWDDVNCLSVVVRFTVVGLVRNIVEALVAKVVVGVVVEFPFKRTTLLKKRLTINRYTTSTIANTCRFIACPC